MRNDPLCLMIVLVIVVFSTGCASKRPVLYPNYRLQEVGQAGAEEDIDDCMQLAVEYGLKSEAGRKVVGQTAEGAATGAAVGAAVGGVTGYPGRGAAAGAAGGGTRGFVRGVSRSRDLGPVQKRFVEECLRERGYRPIGWR